MIEGISPNLSLSSTQKANIPNKLFKESDFAKLLVLQTYNQTLSNFLTPTFPTTEESLFGLPGGGTSTFNVMSALPLGLSNPGMIPSMNFLPTESNLFQGMGTSSIFNQGSQIPGLTGLNQISQLGFIAYLIDKTVEAIDHKDGKTIRGKVENVELKNGLFTLKVAGVNVLPQDVTKVEK